MNDDQDEYREVAERARSGRPDPFRAVMAYSVSLGVVAVLLTLLLTSARSH